MEIVIRSISQAAYVAESYMGFKNIKKKTTTTTKYIKNHKH